MDKDSELNKPLLYVSMLNPAMEKSEYGIQKGNLIYYAEHRSLEEFKYLGEYGGDAYPVAFDTTSGDKRYGVLIASDGVGSGAYRHASLADYYSAGGRWEQENPRNEDDKRSEEEISQKKLLDFLNRLYGEDFFKDEQAVAYALRSFSRTPIDGSYATETGKAPVAPEFYERESQSLASRILTIFIYHRFRNYFKEKDLTPENGEILRREMVEAVVGKVDGEGNLDDRGTLREKIHKIFDADTDGEKPDHRERYFLPCTFSACFFETKQPKLKEKPIVRALSINVGDSRCYVVNAQEGVKLVSKDDAREDGSISRLVRFGNNIHYANGDYDCNFRARYTESETPCAFFVCSDGVYDTCLITVPNSNAQKITLNATLSDFTEYEHYNDTSDTAFELNFQQLLRQAYSMDDVRQLLVRSLYTHSDPDLLGKEGAKTQTSFGGEFASIKFDDSATLSMAFFNSDGNTENFPEILDTLRAAKTDLDAVYEEISKTRYCYNPPAGESGEDKVQGLLGEKLRSGEFGKCIPEIMKSEMQNAYEKAGGSFSFLGDTLSAPKAGFGLKMFVNGKTSLAIEWIGKDDEVLYARKREQPDPSAYTPAQEAYRAYLAARKEESEQEEAPVEETATPADEKEAWEEKPSGNSLTEESASEPATESVEKEEDSVGQTEETPLSASVCAREELVAKLKGLKEGETLLAKLEEMEQTGEFAEIFPECVGTPLIPEDWNYDKHLIMTEESYDILHAALSADGAKSYAELYGKYLEESRREAADEKAEAARKSNEEFVRMAYAAETEGGVTLVGRRGISSSATGQAKGRDAKEQKSYPSDRKMLDKFRIKPKEELLPAVGVEIKRANAVECLNVRTGEKRPLVIRIGKRTKEDDDGRDHLFFGVVGISYREDENGRRMLVSEGEEGAKEKKILTCAFIRDRKKRDEFAISNLFFRLVFQPVCIALKGLRWGEMYLSESGKDDESVGNSVKTITDRVNGYRYTFETDDYGDTWTCTDISELKK